MLRPKSRYGDVQIDTPHIKQYIPPHYELPLFNKFNENGWPIFYFNGSTADICNYETLDVFESYFDCGYEIFSMENKAFPKLL